MQNLTFYIAYNDELKAKSLEVKQKVFIDEQGFPQDSLFDETEKWAVHFVVMEDEFPVATARMLVNEKDYVSLSRVAVIKEYRGKGAGKLIMDRIAEYCKKNKTKKIKLSTQSVTKPFYEKLGYTKKSQINCKLGITHYMMELDLKND